MVDESNHDIKFVTKCFGKDTSQTFDEDVKDHDEFERGVSSTTAAGLNLSLRYNGRKVCTGRNDLWSRSIWGHEQDLISV